MRLPVLLALVLAGCASRDAARRSAGPTGATEGRRTEARPATPWPTPAAAPRETTSDPGRRTLPMEPLGAIAVETPPPPPAQAAEPAPAPSAPSPLRGPLSAPSRRPAREDPLGFPPAGSLPPPAVR
jgi:hypothetical protein